MIRNAVKDDIKAIMKIIKKTIEEMQSYNNDQWNETYPSEEDFIIDIENGDLFVIEREGELAGFACINKVQPLEYKELNWFLKEGAIVIHRMAVNTEFRKKGIGTELMKFADEFALRKGMRYLKIDTYSLNTKMNSLIKKCGYNFVGEIHFPERKKEFYCYEKVLNKNL